MKFTREQVIDMATVAAQKHGHTIKPTDEIVETLTSLCALAADTALEAAAHAFEQHNRVNRQWVNDSLWGNLTTEGCARIRALKDGGAA